jgi:hypothetical protein
MALSLEQGINLLLRYDNSTSIPPLNASAGESCYDCIRLFYTLTEASMYYDLPKLCRRVHTCLAKYLVHFPLLAFDVMEACSQEGPSIPNDLKKEDLSKIQKLLFQGNVDVHMLTNFNRSALELFLVHNGKVMEKHCFLLIDLWCHANDADPDRHSISKKLVKDHVDLQLIDPDDLSTSVVKSGLLTFEQLSNAYQGQAKRATHEFQVSFTKKMIPCVLIPIQHGRAGTIIPFSIFPAMSGKLRR